MYNDNIYFSLYEMMYTDNNYLLLYKRVYNNNKHFLIHESVFLIIREMLFLFIYYILQYLFNLYTIVYRQLKFLK